MKQLLILSGKGGTGKTTIASAFITLSTPKAYGDCDVDAPNLHLVTDWNVEPKKSNYYGLDRAVIDDKLCCQCDLCRQNCRFDAIFIDSSGIYKVDPYACEGCSVCECVCPEDAIDMRKSVDGELMLYKNDKQLFSTAMLKMGSGTSGLLVTEVKKQIKADDAKESDLAIIDGSPGIGCPVIASLSGVDMVLIVAEPSISGISDMERIIKTAAQFGVKIAVCTNKYDTNLVNAERIEKFCSNNNIPFVGRIPYDPIAVKAINSCKSIVEIDCPSGKATTKLYGRTIELLFS